MKRFSHTFEMKDISKTHPQSIQFLFSWHQEGFYTFAVDNKINTSVELPIPISVHFFFSLPRSQM